MSAAQPRRPLSAEPGAAPVAEPAAPQVAIRRGWRLATRFVFKSLLLLLLLQAAGFVALRASIDRSARDILRDELGVAQRVWAQMQAQRSAQLQQGAAVLAADYGFRDAVSSGDVETIASALDNHGARIGSTVAALLDTRFAVRASSAQVSAALAPQLTALAPGLVNESSAVLLVQGRPHQFVMVPLRTPLLVGWVLMGFELDAAVLTNLHEITRQHVSLVVDADAGGPRLLHTSLDAALQPARLAARPPGPGEAELGGRTYLLQDLPLDSAGQARLWLAGSLDQAAALYRELQLTLAAWTGAGLLLFGLGSQWTARRITRPLDSLARASRRIAAGDVDTPIDAALRGGPRRDEVGVLAESFEHMRGSIAAQQQQIRRLAYWDRLTGLPNREQFRDAVLAATATGVPLAVVMLDLDRFKHVNDVLGYAFGDQLLQAVAARLQQVARPGDLVSRLGGDEFALLLPGADAAQAGTVAARIGAAFAQPLTLDDQRVDLSAGLGIACWPAHGADADTLLSRAEVAMYAAKCHTAGAQIYDAGLDRDSAQTLSLLSDLRQALERGELRLFLQPKVALPGGGLVGAEALVRWQHPQRGLVPPMQFIPFAEKTGFVRQLTLWVFEEAARLRPALAALGIERVSVNLSARDLMDGDLPDKLQALLRRHGVSPQAFCLEITESAVMEDPERAEATVGRLVQRGYRLSIDDYGTGYSSLAYLQRLHAHELKIDKGFVMGMVDNEGDAVIVRSTIEMAHSLGLGVVAEGVESAAILERLATLGCDQAQGFHLGKPMPLDHFLAWAEARGASAARPALDVLN